MTDMSKSIGLIGIGLLGQAMADRLLEDGFDVHGCDPFADLDSFVSGGGYVCESANAVAQKSRRIILCLPDSLVSRQVVTGLLPRLKGHTLIDTTTGSPDDALVMADQLGKANSTYIDASVAGSSDLMRRHAATLLVGCSAVTFRDCGDVFKTLASNTYHVGDVGSASRMKLVVNLAIGLNRAVLAEALAFGESLGFDSTQVSDVLRHTPAYSAAMDAKAPKMVQNDFTPQARLRQHLKDVKLILDLARTYQAQVPLSTLHASILSDLVDAGHGDLDNSAIVKAFRQ